MPFYLCKNLTFLFLSFRSAMLRFFLTLGSAINCVKKENKKSTKKLKSKEKRNLRAVPGRHWSTLRLALTISGACFASLLLVALLIPFYDVYSSIHDSLVTSVNQEAKVYRKIIFCWKTFNYFWKNSNLRLRFDVFKPQTFKRIISRYSLFRI